MSQPYFYICEDVLYYIDHKDFNYVYDTLSANKYCSEIWIPEHRIDSEEEYFSYKDFLKWKKEIKIKFGFFSILHNQNSLSPKFYVNNCLEHVKYLEQWLIKEIEINGYEAESKR